MRIGVWSLAHLHAYSYLSVLREHPDIEWLALTDEDVVRGEHYAAEHGLPFIASADMLLEQVDAVIITSANADHAAMAQHAAQAGVHALVEKPIATNLSDARRMVEAFEDANLVLATAFPCPFSPAFQELLRVTRAGDLGKILALRTSNRGSMPGGFFIELDRSGGGAVMDHTVHVADLLRRLVPSPIVRVYAEISHGLFHETWDDSGILTIDFGDGCFATLDCSWSRPRSYPTWGDVILHVVGEKGNATADLFGQHVHLYPAERQPSSWLPWGTNLDALMIDDFVRAVKGQSAPMSSGMDGLEALRVTLAAYESARRNEPVYLGEIA